LNSGKNKEAAKIVFSTQRNPQKIWKGVWEKRQKKLQGAFFCKHGTEEKKALPPQKKIVFNSNLKTNTQKI